MRRPFAFGRRASVHDAGQSAPGSVDGERGAALVGSVQGMQSRASSILAAGLMLALGGGALSWYYAHALGRPTRARQTAQATLATRAQGEMPLPSLGPIEQPVVTAERVAPPPAVNELPLAEAPSAGVPVATSAPAPKTPEELALERRLSGAVFARGGSALSPNDPAGKVRSAPAVDESRGVGASGSAMTALLEPTATASVSAQRIANPRFLLPKGAFIDCTLETAIDSTLPGMTTCVTAADTFGTDGRVVLLERGTKLVGETRGQVQQGQARVFVLWTEARTPGGVVVPLDSPGTDELGRSGLPGEVDRHFWQRFGAGILISLINGGVQAAVQAVSPAGGTIVYAPSASQDVATEVFKDTLRIPPTITKKNGDRIQVLVARDVDFASVYELHSAVAN